jgi:hypothetical protein
MMVLKGFENQISVWGCFHKWNSNDEAFLREEMARFERFLQELGSLDQELFGNLYINSGKDEKPPYSNPLNDEKTREKLIQSRLKDQFRSYEIWNGWKGDEFPNLSKFVGITLSGSDINFEISDRNVISRYGTRWFITTVFQCMLRHFPVRAAFVRPALFFDHILFPHRVECGWIQYAAGALTPEQLPEAEFVSPVNNEHNQGTLIISTLQDFKGTEPEIIERINKIAVRLVDLELLPLQTPDDFYDAAGL